MKELSKKYQRKVHAAKNVETGPDELIIVMIQTIERNISGKGRNGKSS